MPALSLNLLYVRLAALVVLGSSLYGCAGTVSANPAPGAASIPNLSAVKTAITSYHDSGQWEREKQAVMLQAENWISLRAKQGGKLAVVFDIDETALDNWPNDVATDFGYMSAPWNTWLQQGIAPANASVLHFYQVAKSLGVAEFFVTGRPESSRASTEQNLLNVGYTGFTELVLKPSTYTDSSIVPYKSGARLAIEQQGYTIIANVGDQQSDLDGGHAERGFKLPNPMYFLP